MILGVLVGILASPGAAVAGDIFLSPDAARELVDAGAAVLDARGNKPWRQGHIPGSWLVDWKSTRAGLLQAGLRSGRLRDDTAALQTLFRDAGVRDADPVLVVGAAREGWGEEGRIFWTLEYLGHSDVHILDGGMAAWEAAGLPVSQDMTPPARGDFTARPQPTRRATKEEVAAGLGQAEVAFWDTREPREYAGATPYLEPRGGHLPGAAHLWFEELMTEAGTLRPEAELRALLAGKGLVPDKQIVAYCTGGVRSGFAYAVLRELGYPRPVNYDGSMWEWTADADAPLE